MPRPLRRLLPLLALVAGLGLAPPAHAAPGRSVVVEDVKAKDVRQLQRMGDAGYFLLVEGRQEGWQTAHTLSTWDLDLNPLGQGTIQLPAGAQLSRGVFDGEQIYLTTTDLVQQEIQVHAFTTAARPAGVVTLPGDLKPAYRPYLYGVAAAAPGAGVYLTMLDLYKRKFACKALLIGRDRTVRWEQPVFHPKGFTRCSALEDVGEGRAVQLVSHTIGMGGRTEMDLRFLDPATGAVVARHRLHADDHVHDPTTVYPTDDGLFLAGASWDARQMPLRPPDGFFVTRLQRDGAVDYSLRANWDAEAWWKFRGADEATYDAMVGHRANMLVHEVWSLGGHDVVVAELVRWKIGGNSTTPAGKPRTTATTFGDYLIIRIARDSGALVDLQLVPKADRTVQLPAAVTEELGFARVAREQGWSGFLFSEPIGDDGALRVVSWSNEAPGRSLDTLTIAADGTVSTGHIPLDAMRRRDRTALFRSSPGHVVVVQYVAKERRLTLEQVALD